MQNLTSGSLVKYGKVTGSTDSLANLEGVVASTEITLVHKSGHKKSGNPRIVAIQGSSIREQTARSDIERGRLFLDHMTGRVIPERSAAGEAHGDLRRLRDLGSFPVEAAATGGLVGNGRASPGKTRLSRMSWSAACSGPASSPIGLMSISSPR